jgi:hypothetical protein
MKLRFALLLSVATLTFAQSGPQSGQSAKPSADAAIQAKPAVNPPAASNPQVVKKMGSVTWDPESHKLLWKVQTGSLVNGEFVPGSEEQYEISPDEATMGTSAEKRGLDGDEAEGLHQLLDILSIYCAESVAWWDRGMGAPVTPDKTTPDSSPAQKPVKIRQPETKPETKPAPLRPIPGTLVAELKGNQ